MIAKFLSDNEAFEFTEQNKLLLESLTDSNYEMHVQRLLRDYYTQGKRKNISEEELKAAETALLLQRAIISCNDTLIFAFADKEIVDMTLTANLNLVKKICKEVNIPYDLPLFLIARNSIPYKKDSTFLNKMISQGLNPNSVFLFDIYKERNKKLINKALESRNLDVFEKLLHTAPLNTDPGFLTSIPLTPEHPFLEESADSGFLSYYFIPEINKVVKETHKHMAKAKTPFFHDYESYEALLDFRIASPSIIYEAIEQGQYDDYLKQNNVDNLLVSAFFDSKIYDNDEAKKYFKKVINTFKENGITISAQQKEAILYLLIQQDSLTDGMLPWKLTVNNKQALVGLLEKLEVHKINESSTKKQNLLGTYDDDLIFKYIDDYKKMLHDKKIRDLIETSILSTVVHCLYDLAEDGITPVSALNNFFNYPVFKILIESEYKISTETMDALKNQLNNFKDSNKSLQESVTIIADNLESILYNSDKNPAIKKRL